MNHLGDAAVARLRAGHGSMEELLAARDHAADCPSCAARLKGEQAPAADEASPPGQPGALETAASAPLPRGASVGRYLVLQAVGEGGMGVVYAAYDPELERKVALKLLRAVSTKDHNRTENQARLLREAQAMARVSHPNVTGVHDVGTFGDQIFVAMDLVEGTDLRSWLKQEQRPWRRVLEVLVAAGRGLAAAHAAGLVHRDFKPENVLVGKDGRVQVSDFGLARLADAVEHTPNPNREDSSGSWDHGVRMLSPLTQSGIVVGTPAYMAPELHQGRAPDTRSDQFSFCATLYYALYGKRAFDPRKVAALAKDAVDGEQRSMSSLLGTLRMAAGAGGMGVIAPPPREPHVPFWVKRALMRGLSVAPEQRFASMDELLEALAKPPGTARRAWVAVGLVLALAAGYYVATMSERRERATCGGDASRLQGIWDPSVAHQVETAFSATGASYAPRAFQSVKSVLDTYARDWTGMHVEACQATRVRGEQSERVLALRLECLDRRLGELRSLARLLAQADPQTLERAVDAAHALPPVSRCADVAALTASPRPVSERDARAAVEISGRLSEARVLVSAGMTKKGRALAVEGVAEARKLAQPALLAEALIQEGRAEIMDRDEVGAERNLREAWRLAEENRSDALRAQAAIYLIEALVRQGTRLEVAREWGGIAESALNRLGRPPELEIELRRVMGLLLVHDRQWSAGREQFARAITLLDRTFGPDAPEKLSIINASSLCDYAEGRYEEAAVVLEAALEVSERVEGKGHPHGALIHNNLANMYLAQGRVEEALPHARESVSILEALVGGEHPLLASSLNTEAAVLTRLGRHAESISLNERSLRLHEQVEGLKSPDTAFMLEGLGEAYLGENKPREALGYLEHALALGPPEPLLLADTRFFLALALERTGGDRKRIHDLVEQAREGYRAVSNKVGLDRVERWSAERPR